MNDVKRLSKVLPLALLAALSLRVEDGQFTREYSRIYTTLVYATGALLLLLVIAGLYSVSRRNAQNAF